jgi:hypothetical protein
MRLFGPCNDGGFSVTLPHTLKRIRLNLARSKQFPSGSDRHGYEFVAPLDAVGHIDPQLWHQYRDHCRVRRFWQGEDDQVGRLVHRAGRGGPFSAWRRSWITRGETLFLLEGSIRSGAPRSS